MRKTTISLLLLLLTTEILYGQASRPADGKISGRILEATSGNPVEYANILLYKARDSSLFTGTISNNQGFFMIENIPYGPYFVVIKFLGFKDIAVPGFAVNPNKKEHYLGNFKLQLSEMEMAEFEIKEQKAAIEYKIDRKIINVEQHFNASGGTAVDVLENTPSVQVDIEGNVSVRGSSNFTLLIDGRPTIMDASELLQQMPASQIEQIEIITNPSAMYDPEGTAGIINIISKKEKRQGSNGLFNISTSSNQNFGIDFLLNYRKDKINYWVGMEYNDRGFNGKRESESRTFMNDTTSYLLSEGDMKRGRGGFAAKTGFDYQINPLNAINFGVDWQYFTNNRKGDGTYTNYSDPFTTLSYYSSVDDNQRNGNRLGANFNWEKKFNNTEHKINTNLNYQLFDHRERTENLHYLNREFLDEAQRSYEDKFSHNMQLKIDYQNKWKENLKFESGFHTKYESEEADYSFNTYNPDSFYWETDPARDMLSDYSRLISALYFIVNGERKKLGYQLGLRGEYTYRELDHNNVSKPYKIDRFDIFPTVHFSYKLNESQQLLLSYARRIDRPRNYYLEPFQTWMSPYMIREGNPGLKPEYINSFELGYQFTLSKQSFLAMEAYHRQTINKIERIQRVYSQDVMLHTFENIGEDYATGVELMLNLAVFKWWNINSSASFYNYLIDMGRDDNIRESNNWGTRMNNTIKMAENSRIQVTLGYRGPSITSQGRREGSLMSDIAFRQDLFKRSMTLTFRVRDPLGAGKWEFTSEGDGFFSYNKMIRESPVYMLSLTYRLNNYKSRDKNGRGGGEDFDMIMDGE
jgi:outer membrane receptor protein involved in Fe transport